ncbi:hypothetical protein IJ670_08620 [bacterium]|nr:hypothetical protein [bacterium]
MQKRKRTTFSDTFKRKAVINYILGKSWSEIFPNINSSDKKYSSKLLHKWRIELYSNKEKMYFINQEMTNSALQDEIELMTYDSDTDEIMTTAKSKFTNCVQRYKEIQNSIHELIQQSRKPNKAKKIQKKFKF